MTQTGVVTKILNSNYAEVEIERKTACGSNCASCGGDCIYARRIRATVRNKSGAVCGDTVMLESPSKSILSAAALIYLLPIAALFAFYGIAAALKFSQGLCILIGIIGLCAGIAAAVIYGNMSRKGEKIDLEIVQILD